VLKICGSQVRATDMTKMAGLSGESLFLKKAPSESVCVPIRTTNCRCLQVSACLPLHFFQNGTRLCLSACVFDIRVVACCISLRLSRRLGFFFLTPFRLCSVHSISLRPYPHQGCSASAEKGVCKITPAEERGCTDTPCCLLFLAFWGAVLALMGYAIGQGATPLKAVYGRDYNGKTCGVDAEVASQPLTAWPFIIKYPTVTMCVAKCEETMDISSNSRMVLGNQYASTQCTFPRPRFFGLTCMHRAHFPCGRVGWVWMRVLYPADFGTSCIAAASARADLKMCVPSNLNATVTAAFASNSDWNSMASTASRAMGDLSTGWGVIAIGAALALVFAFFYMKLVQCAGAVLVWGMAARAPGEPHASLLVSLTVSALSFHRRMHLLLLSHYRIVACVSVIRPDRCAHLRAVRWRRRVGHLPSKVGGHFHHQR
jgi:hypothetical protein